MIDNLNKPAGCSLIQRCSGNGLWSNMICQCDSMLNDENGPEGGLLIQ